WNFIGEQFFCEQEEGFSRVGYFRDTFPLINFARIPYGSGYFYLHTTPIAFSNLNMLNSSNKLYAEGVFSHLSPGTIYWDEYSRISEATGRRMNNSNRSSNRTLSNRTPLEYILNQPPLAMAWYLLLFALLIYLLFKSKRKQRIIPILSKNENTSLEFVTTMGRLYFIQNDHRKLAIQKMRLFKSFIRSKYKITIKDDYNDEALLNTISVISEVPRELVNNVFMMYRNIDTSSVVTDNTLIEFHNRLEAFYQNCK
ncbi:MAG: hypothetical protein AAFO07_32960, partial [Bacteroidota bacterium]